MRHLSARYVLLFLIIGSDFLCMTSARAGLGSDAAQVLADGDQLRGIVQLVARQQYDMEEISTGTGTRVREFLTRGGLVFAVSWSGPVEPDLRQLLGSHYAAYTKALSALSHPGIRRSVRVASSELIVESGGHMRAYSGRAYLPALIPPGVPLAELR